MAPAVVQLDSAAHRRRLRVGFVAVAVVLFASLVAVALVLSQAQQDSRDAATQRFSEPVGHVITRQGQVSLSRPPASDRINTRAAVPGTPWLLRVEAERDRVLAGANGVHTLPWLILAALALSAAAGMGLAGAWPWPRAVSGPPTSRCTRAASRSRTWSTRSRRRCS